MDPALILTSLLAVRNHRCDEREHHSVLDKIARNYSGWKKSIDDISE
jgi:hypothetical protein